MYEAARENGTLVSVKELALLLPEQTSESELLDVISTVPSLSSRLEHRAGYVVGKDLANQRLTTVASESKNRERARSNLSFAGRFVSRAAGRSLLMIGVSGSTSYRSASRSRDLDFFCVTRRSDLWPQLTKLLIRARAFRLANRGSPELCFSCTMDEGYASEAFGVDQGPLFARDALQTVVMDGGAFYGELLRKADWIRGYYPSFHRTRAAGGENDRAASEGRTGGSVALNRLFYMVAGTYIRLKCFLRNRALAKQGRTGSRFELLIGEDHLIYESVRYKQMRKAYGAASGR